MSKVRLKLTIPRTLADITLGQYQDYMKVVDEVKKGKKEDEELSSGEIEWLNKKTLQIFCGVELKETYNVPLTAFMAALEQVERCFAQDTPLVRDWIIKDINGVEQRMGFIPDLEKMSFGEYVDLDGFLGDWSQMHKAMAILFRPVRYASKELYRIEEYKGKETLDTYADVMKLMPVNIALGAVVFFYRLGAKLLDATMSYLENQPEVSSHFRETLPNGGAGIRASLHLQMETLLDLMRLRRFHSVKP
jgi:hypothetical protein